MRSDIIYGRKDERSGLGQFVELFMCDEDNRLGIEWFDKHQGTIFYFSLRDKDDYEDFKNELIAVLKECADIGEAYYALEVYLNSEYADDFLAEYTEEVWEGNNELQ